MSPFGFSVAFACDVEGFAAAALAATAGSPATAASPAVRTKNFRSEISTFLSFSFPNGTCDITNFLSVEVALRDRRPWQTWPCNRTIGERRCRINPKVRPTRRHYRGRATCARFARSTSVLIRRSCGRARRLDPSSIGEEYDALRLCGCRRLLYFGGAEVAAPSISLAVSFG